MTQTERTDASISSNPSSGSPLAYPSLAAFEAHLGALGAKPAHLRRICRAWLGSASAAWPDALGAQAWQPARSPGGSAACGAYGGPCGYPAPTRALC